MILIRIRYRVVCYMSFKIYPLLQYFLKKVPSEYESKGRKRIGVPNPPPPISPLHGAVVRTNKKWKSEYNSKKARAENPKKKKLYVFLVCRIKQRDSQIKVLMPQPVHKLLKLP